jgi:hypothetical protein
MVCEKKRKCMVSILNVLHFEKHPVAEYVHYVPAGEQATSTLVSDSLDYREEFGVSLV